jgi:hypothetical protein
MATSMEIAMANTETESVKTGMIGKVTRMNGAAAAITSRRTGAMTGMLRSLLNLEPREKGMRPRMLPCPRPKRPRARNL